MVRHKTYKLGPEQSYDLCAVYEDRKGMRANLLYCPRPRDYPMPVCSLTYLGNIHRFLWLPQAVEFNKHFEDVLDFSLIVSLVEISLDASGDPDTMWDFYTYLWVKWCRNDLGLYSKKGKVEDGVTISRAELRLKRDTLRTKFQVYQMVDLLKVHWFEFLSKRIVWVFPGQSHKGGRRGPPHPLNEQMQQAMWEFEMGHFLGRSNS